MSRPVRRGQVIAPFGPGAMVDFPGALSLIHAGLDAWGIRPDEEIHKEFKIDDEWRLSSRLGVDFFVNPPDFRRRQRRNGVSDDRPNLEMTLPFLLFPLWHVCPRCNRMHLSSYHDEKPPECTGPFDDGTEHKKQVTYQVRFIAACKKGHIQDFPWIEWVFGSPTDWVPDMNRWLKMSTSKSASLASIRIDAMERVNGQPRSIKHANLGQAFHAEFDQTDPQMTPLGRVGVCCNGTNPVMATGTEVIQAQDCGDPLFALLRNASNVYFPDVVSSIFIPSIKDDGIPEEVLTLLDSESIKGQLRNAAKINELNGLVTKRAAQAALNDRASNVTAEQLADAANKHILHTMLDENPNARSCIGQYIQLDGVVSLEAIEKAIKHVDEEWVIDPQYMLNIAKPYFEGKSKKLLTEIDPEKAESSYRFQEYKIFVSEKQQGYPKNDLVIEHRAPLISGGILSSVIERIGLMKRLRETRAFRGFSRIRPFNPGNKSSAHLFKSSEVRWLPAIVVRGEGIFLHFKRSAIDYWLENNKDFLEKRLNILQAHIAARAERIGQSIEPVSAAMVMLHTFAHVMINEFVYQCGYGSASLRERIYSAEDEEYMSGVLIYTAAGDSEGTMGGLVRMGEEDRLELLLNKALRKALWCSSDPICIESTGQGPDNCNLAACHNCGLLPETSCEMGNRMLDRALLVGTLENPGAGFFSQFVRHT